MVVGSDKLSFGTDDLRNEDVYYWLFRILKRLLMYAENIKVDVYLSPEWS